MTPEPHVWIFSGVSGRFPGGVFTSLEVAEAWIAKYHLTGVLTAYPLDEGCFDWAMRSGVVTGRARDRGADPAFVGSFTSASQEHFHYEGGTRQ
jgi:hypothetical protein